MAQINKPTDYFNTLLYTGDMVDGDGSGHTQSITGVGFTPDWVWHKGRSAARPHIIVDSVRGTTNYNTLSSQDTNAESTTNTNGSIKSIDSDGITLEAGTDSTSKAVNAGGSGNTYVTWNWLAGGSASSNTDGSITSSVSANTTSGFSIVTWTGNATDSTVGHGLNSAPEFIIVKNRTDAGNDWRVAQTITASNNMTDGNGYYLDLNDTKASTNPGSAVLWGATPTAPTSSVFTVGTNNGINGSSDNMLAYCFHSVKGYSKFGEYTGNGSADGTFVYTGFKPAMIIWKNASSAYNWVISDNKRSTFNIVNDYLLPNTGAAEATTDLVDFTSNGFKIRTTNAALNNSGNTFIYMAFAENPLVGTNNIPATAR